MKKGITRLALTVVWAFTVIVIGKFSVSAAPLQMPDGTIFDPVYYADSNTDLKIYYGYNGGAL